jgi:hypothetical protein
LAGYAALRVTLLIFASEVETDIAAVVAAHARAELDATTAGVAAALPEALDFTLRPRFAPAVNANLIDLAARTKAPARAPPQCELDFGDLDEPELDDVPVFYVD